MFRMHTPRRRFDQTGSPPPGARSILMTSFSISSMRWKVMISKPCLVAVSSTAFPMTHPRSSMSAKCFAISVQILGGEIVGIRLHQPLSVTSPISMNTSLFRAATTPAGVLTTGCGDGGSTCGGIHNYWTGAASVPNVVSIRYLSHLMVTGSIVSTAVGLNMLHPGVTDCTIPALRH